jgi:hypothetical protein
MSRISEKSPALTLTVRPATTPACIGPNLGYRVLTDPHPRPSRIGGGAERLDDAHGGLGQTAREVGD